MTRILEGCVIALFLMALVVFLIGAVGAIVSIFAGWYTDPRYLIIRLLFGGAMSVLLLLLPFISVIKKPEAQ